MWCVNSAAPRCLCLKVTCKSDNRGELTELNSDFYCQNVRCSTRRPAAPTCTHVMLTSARLTGQVGRMEELIDHDADTHTPKGWGGITDVNRSTYTLCSLSKWKKWRNNKCAHLQSLCETPSFLRPMLIHIPATHMHTHTPPIPLRHIHTLLHPCSSLSYFLLSPSALPDSLQELEVTGVRKKSCRIQRRKKYKGDAGSNLW